MIKRILTVLIVVALLVAPLTVSPGRALASSVSVTSVTVTPPTVGAVVTDMSFTLTTAVTLYATQTIQVQFSGQTIVAGSKTGLVTIDAGAIAISGATATSNSVSITLNATMSPTSHVIRFLTGSGITNPAYAGSAYVIVTTSSETSGWSSFTVTSGTQPAYLYYFSDTWIAGSAASHYITFAPSSISTQPAPGTTVSVQFPVGTSMPLPAYNYTGFTFAGIPVTFVSIVGTRVDITVPTGVTGAASYQIVIPVTFQIRHTTTASTSNVLQLWTTGDQSPQSFTFATQGGSVAIQSVSVSPLTPSSVAQFAISFYTSSSATGIKYGDTISVEFPAGTQFPSGSFCPSCFVINGQAVQATPTRSNNIVTIAVPTTLPTASQYVYLTIGTTASIINPSTSGSYSLKVSTSLDTTQVTSSQYTLVGTSISNLAVTANPTAQSAYPELTFTFTTSSTGALSTSDYVYIQFPTAMTVPSSVPAASVAVNSVQASSVSRDGSGKLSIRMPLSVGNYQQVTVIIAATSGISNPSTIGTTLSFDVSTSEDVGTRSISYTTTTSQISQPQVTLTTNGIGKPSGYTVAFQVGAGGALTAGIGRIYIVFPSGTSVPTTIAGQYVRVNGAAAFSVVTSPGNRRVEITTPVAVPASSQVSVVLDVAANIVNPLTPATSYTLTVYTSAEQTLVNSVQYSIVNLPTSNAVTIPAAPDGLNSYYRTRPVVSITASSPSGYPVSIYYRINTGADTLYGGPVQIPDGTVTFTYYAKDSQNNQEQAQQLTFKVDTTAPVVTILSPQEGTVTSTGALSITGRTEAGASVTINGSPVAVQPSGDFGGSITLSEGANAIQIVATDVAGNVGQTRLNVTLDTKPPVLTVTSPKIYSTVMTQQVAVSGKTEAGATVTVAGAQVSVAADGSFSIMYMFPKEGLNVVDVTATDAAGNTARASIPVTYVARTLIRLQVGNKTAMINDAAKTLQAAPVNVKGVVMVPLRFIGEAFGATVEWEPVFTIVRLQLASTTIYLQVGSNYASVNGKKIVLQGLPSIIKGTTMVPIRFISEAFNAEVVWNAPTQGIDITYPKP